jgi:hypothetical protein
MSTALEAAAYASSATGPWRSVRDSNPQPDGYGVAVFGTAGLPIGLTLRTTMAESVGLEPTRVSQRDRGLASRCFTTQPALHNVVAPGGVEPSGEAMPRCVYSAPLPPTGLRRHWWAGRDSNPQTLGSEPSACAKVLLPALKSGRHGRIRTFNTQALNLRPLPKLGYVPERESSREVASVATARIDRRGNDSAMSVRSAP